jgi:hypothetical protein
MNFVYLRTLTPLILALGLSHCSKTQYSDVGVKTEKFGASSEFGLTGSGNNVASTIVYQPYDDFRNLSFFYWKQMSWDSIGSYVPSNDEANRGGVACVIKGERVYCGPWMPGLETHLFAVDSLKNERVFKWAYSKNGYQCAIRTNGGLGCWQIIPRVVNNKTVGARFVGLGVISQLQAGERHIDIASAAGQFCTLTNLGNVYCWGLNLRDIRSAIDYKIPGLLADNPQHIYQVKLNYQSIVNRSVLTNFIKSMKNPFLIPPDQLDSTFDESQWKPQLKRINQSATKYSRIFMGNTALLLATPVSGKNDTFHHLYNQGHYSERRTGELLIYMGGHSAYIPNRAMVQYSIDTNLDQMIDLSDNRALVQSGQDGIYELQQGIHVGYKKAKIFHNGAKTLAELDFMNSGNSWLPVYHEEKLYEKVNEFEIPAIDLAVGDADGDLLFSKTDHTGWIRVVIPCADQLFNDVVGGSIPELSSRVLYLRSNSDKSLDLKWDESDSTASRCWTPASTRIYNNLGGNVSRIAAKQLDQELGRYFFNVKLSSDTDDLNANIDFFLGKFHFKLRDGRIHQFEQPYTQSSRQNRQGRYLPAAVGETVNLLISERGHQNISVTAAPIDGLVDGTSMYPHKKSTVDRLCQEHGYRDSFRVRGTYGHTSWLQKFFHNNMWKLRNFGRTHHHTRVFCRNHPHKLQQIDSNSSSWTLNLPPNIFIHPNDEIIPLMLCNRAGFENAAIGSRQRAHWGDKDRLLIAARPTTFGLVFGSSSQVSTQIICTDRFRTTAIDLSQVELNECPDDVNGDERISTMDLAYVASGIGSIPTDSDRRDIDKDGRISSLDSSFVVNRLANKIDCGQDAPYTPLTSTNSNGSGVEISGLKSSYTVADSISVQYNKTLTGTVWMTLIQKSASLSTYSQYTYLDDGDGSFTFDNRHGAGELELRLFQGSGFDLISRYPVNVEQDGNDDEEEDDDEQEPSPDPNVFGVVISGLKASYTLAQPITFQYNKTGTEKSWITFVRKDTSTSLYKQWTYLSGQGTYTFDHLGAGEFEVRVYRGGGYDIHATYPVSVAP